MHHPSAALTQLTALLAGFALASCGSPPTITGRVVEESMTSVEIDDDYELLIRLPPGYDESSDRYPLVVQLDADRFGPQFDITAGHASDLAAAGDIPEVIVVGIGGGNRFRDYTVDGAEAFLRFVREQVLVHVDATYRTDPSAGRIFMGHSLGGFFTLYTMLTTGAEADPPFSTFVAADPTLTHGDARLFELEADLATRTGSLPVRLYLPIARFSGATQQLYYEEMLERLRSNYPDVELSAEVLELDHGETIDPSLRQGLRFAFGDAS